MPNLVEVPIQNNELYAVMQKLRSHDRYDISQPEVRDAKQSHPSPNDTLSKAWNLYNRYIPPEKATLEQVAVGAEEIQTSGGIERLAKERETLRVEAGKLGTDEEQNILIQESTGRLRGYIVNATNIKNVINAMQSELRSLKESAALDTNRVNAATIDQKNNYEEMIKNLRGVYKDQLPFIDPESFLAHNLLQLRDFKHQLNTTNIVTTETLANLEEEITLKLMQKGMVALVGETGTGKTQVSKRIATESYKKFHLGEKGSPYYFVTGHKFTTREDLLSFLGLETKVVAPEQALRLSEEAKARYLQMVQGDMEATELEERLKTIDQIVLNQSSTPQFSPKEFLGQVMKAAEEGKIVIIDEFNYINPALLASINEVMQTRPGSFIITPAGNKIEVKKGFGIIFTGNLSLSNAQRYLERSALDPAFINRLNSGLFEYNTPPQDEIDLTLNNCVIDSVKRKNGEKPKKRELFQISMAILVDQKGNLYAPEDSLEKVWKMTQAFKVFQNNFAGKPLRDSDKFSDGTELRLQQSHASMRTLVDILKSWKAEGFRYPLDYHLYEHLIRPTSVIAPREAAYFFSIMKNSYGFFEGNYWEGKLEIEQASKNLKLNGAINKNDVSIADQRLKLFTAQEVAEAFAGYKMPETITVTTVEGKTNAPSRELVMAKISEMQHKRDEIATFLREFNKFDKETGDKGALQLFCKDEAAIMGAAA
ncbi:MAG: AAA family ATPase [Candidatus Roizmanbacteria bacterium]|nr:MAG: AAA family ATPase [Candidatus Roizmanbacteria bacterium]